MSVTAEALQEFIGTTDNVDAYLAEANELIAKRIGAADVPDSVLDPCTLRVGERLWQLDHAPSGQANQQFATADGVGVAPSRFPRNPLAPVENILGRWVPRW